MVMKEKSMSKLSRWALLALVVLVMVLPPRVDAGPMGCTGYTELQSFAFEQITVSSTAVGFTATKYAPAGQRPADMAVVNVESNAVRYRDDGLNPTAAVGQPIASAASVLVCGQGNVATIKFIRQTSDATVSVTYYRVTQ